MPNSLLMALAVDSWDDADRAHADLSDEGAMQRFRGGSAFGWTYAHLGKQVDELLNVRAQGLEPNPVVNQEHFDFGGSGDPADWSEIRNAVAEVRAVAKSFLEPLSDRQLAEIKVPSRSRGRDVSLQYTLCRIATHRWFHTGEVASKREMDGQQTGYYPGRLDAYYAATEKGGAETGEVASFLVQLLRDAWDDSDRAFAGLNDADATTPHFDGSPFGWTLAHFTGQMNMFATVLLGRGEQPAIFEHPTINESVPMTVADWTEVRTAVERVRRDVGSHLEGLDPSELAAIKVPATSRTPEVRLSYMLGRFIAHHYFHIGEVASKRDMLGHSVGDYPGRLSHALGGMS